MNKNILQPIAIGIPRGANISQALLPKMPDNPEPSIPISGFYNCMKPLSKATQLLSSNVQYQPLITGQINIIQPLIVKVPRSNF